MEPTESYKSRQRHTDYLATTPSQPIPVYLPSPAPYPKGLIRLTFVLVFYALAVLVYQFPPMNLLRSFANQLGAFTATPQPASLYLGDYRNSAASSSDKYVYRLESNHPALPQKRKTIKAKRGLTGAELPVSAGIPPEVTSINSDSISSSDALLPASLPR